MPRIDAGDRELRLTFCTNALPSDTVDQQLASLDQVLPAWREAVGDGPVQLGLWLPSTVAAALDELPTERAAWRESLQARELEVFTLNGFPFGDFHRGRVKEDVFLPAWDDPDRLTYTQRLGRLLAELLAPEETGSISTLACGLKRLHQGRSFARDCAAQLLELAASWSQVEAETGRHLILGLEPEPGSTLETILEFESFYADELLSKRAASTLRDHGVPAGQEEAVVRRHLGICYDLCHQAVEFEGAAVALDRLRLAGIPIAKLQITNALDVEAPGTDDETLALLQRFAEPRYLHQVTRQDQGKVELADDLEELLANPSPEWLAADRWRIHFHVPVHRDTVSGLGTTREEMRAGLRHVLRHDLTRHLEVETYTWGVLAEEQLDQDSLAVGIGKELKSTREDIARFLAS